MHVMWELCASGARTWCSSLERAAAAALQLAQAGKRCSPSDPDKSRPKAPSLPWWDDLRFLWRGSIELSAM